MKLNIINSYIPNNVFDYLNCVQDTSYYVDTGEPFIISGWMLTDFIEVPSYASGFYALNYIMMGGITYRMSNQWVAQYDKNKNFIGNLHSDSSNPLGIEHARLNSNCKYIRSTTYARNTNMVLIFDTKNIEDSTLDVFRFHDYTQGGVIGYDGQVIEHGSFSYTDYIAVPSWCKSVTTCNIADIGTGPTYTMSDYRFSTYDSDKTFIETVHYKSTDRYVTTNIDSSVVKYIRVDFTQENYNDHVCIFNTTLKDQTTANSKWNNTTGNFLGDSITAQNYYTSKLSTMFGITVNNYGVSGTTISNKSGSNYFATRVSSMTDDCDFIFMLGGTNDWGLSAPLGDTSDTSADTFYGGLYLVLNSLRSKYPTKPIFVSNILQRDWQEGGQCSGIDSNLNGNSLDQFNNAIEYMSRRFGCYLIDAFGSSGICINNISDYCLDRLHLNSVGGTRYAQFIKDCMELFTP